MLGGVDCAPAKVAGPAVDAAGVIAGVNINAAHFVPRLEVCPGLKPPQAPEMLQGVALSAIIGWHAYQLDMLTWKGHVILKQSAQSRLLCTW